MDLWRDSQDRVMIAIHETNIFPSFPSANPRYTLTWNCDRVTAKSQIVEQEYPVYIDLA